MEDNRIDLKAVIEYFATNTIHDIKSESEVPRVNFIFNKEGIKLFQIVKEHPYQIDRKWDSNIKEEDIKALLPENNRDNTCPIIVVNDALIFFDTITKITNAYIRFSTYYGYQCSPKATALQIMRRIWLRMGIDELTNVEDFLQKQLEFIESEIFLENRFETKIDTLGKYDVLMKVNRNRSYDETTRNMSFKIVTKEKTVYELPHVHYDIDNNGVCYLYAVQSDSNIEQDKKVERILYRLNAGIKDTNNHPSFVYSTMLFLNYLKENGITKVKVPKLQVLSYRYHQLLGEKTKREFISQWGKEPLEQLKDLPEWMYKERMIHYKQDKLWYDHTVGKEDFIHKTKTEGLFHLIERMKYHIPNIEINNSTDSDYIDINLEKSKRIKKDV